MFGLRSRKQGNELELFQAPAPGTPEQHAERRLREWGYRARGADGRVPSKAFYKLAEGDLHPLRILMRRVREGDDAGMSEEQLRELGVIVTDYLEQIIARRSRSISPRRLHLESRSTPHHTPRALPAHVLPMGAAR